MSSWYRNLPSVQEIELALSRAGLTNVKLQRRQIEAWLEDLRLNYNQYSSESDIPAMDELSDRNPFASKKEFHPKKAFTTFPSH